MDTLIDTKDKVRKKMGRAVILIFLAVVYTLILFYERKIPEELRTYFLFLVVEQVLIVFLCMCVNLY